VAETGNDNGGHDESRGRATDGSPPSYGSGDPEWVTGGFSNLDLGEEAAEAQARPVRRLDLPPLAQTNDSPGVADDADPVDSGLFASVPDDENLTVSSSAGGDHTSVQPVRGDDAHSGGHQPSAFEPKQGTPPHPRTAARGAGMDGGSVGGSQDRYGPTPDAGLRPNDDYTAHYPDDMAGYGDQFGGPTDRRAGAPIGGQSAGSPGGRGGPPQQPGRSHLELAPSMPVQQANNRWMIPVAAMLGVLALAAGYWVFVRGNDDSANLAADSDDLAADLVEEDLEGEPTEGSTASTDPAAPAVLSDSPVLTLDGAASGPLETETQYEMIIDGVPDNAQYLVVVDDIPQEPALDYLPVLILPEGRHTISVNVTAGAQTAETNAVDVYVLAPELTATHRANLSSVSVSEQGWEEALKQFDAFRAAGHENLMLSPSDPYPSLLPGFWNLYVAGFADTAAAAAYCEEAGLAIPDACYPAPFDPNGPPRDG